MKQLEVQIMGQTYLLGCPAGGEGRLLDAVERVDTAMCRIRDAGKVRSRERIAVLAALNLSIENAPPPPPEADTLLADTSPKTASDTLTVAAPSTDSDVLLISLLERLDHALGEDGHLI